MLHLVPMDSVVVNAIVKGEFGSGGTGITMHAVTFPQFGFGHKWSKILVSGKLDSLNV